MQESQEVNVAAAFFTELITSLMIATGYCDAADGLRESHTIQHSFRWAFEEREGSVSSFRSRSSSSLIQAIGEGRRRTI